METSKCCHGDLIVLPWLLHSIAMGTSKCCNVDFIVLPFQDDGWSFVITLLTRLMFCMWQNVLWGRLYGNECNPKWYITVQHCSVALHPSVIDRNVSYSYGRIGTPFSHCQGIKDLDVFLNEWHVFHYTITFYQTYRNNFTRLGGCLHLEIYQLY